MEKLKTGIATNMDFIKAAAVGGQEVKAEFPAETLKNQLNQIGDVQLTFEATSEEVLKKLNTAIDNANNAKS